MKIRYGSIGISLAVTFFLLIIVVILVKQEQVRYEDDLRANVVGQLSQVRARLETEVNASLHLTRGLVSLVMAYPDFTPEKFSKVGEALLHGKTNVRNVGLAPNNILNYIYPIKGNEKAIGLVYQDNQDQWPAVEKAIQSRSTLISGPLKLVEGDQAFISLTPIWHSSESSRQDVYWGIASMVINAETLFNNAGVHQTASVTRLAMRGTDGMGAQGKVFYGDAAVFDTQPTLMEVTLPSGTWQLGATPLDGWSQSSPNSAKLWSVGIAVSLLCGFLVFMWFSNQVHQRNALTKAKQDAEKANAAKSEFLSRMSHELRTPLHAILGFGQLLENNSHQSLDEEQKEFIHHIMRSGHHLLSLINEVLDLVKIDSGKSKLLLENITLANLVDECIMLSRPSALNHGVSLMNECPDIQELIVHADAMRLKQALLNLISNAIKYNQRNGSVKVSCQKTTDDFIKISVTDTGKGIPQDKHDHLFQPFNRLGAEGTKIEGTGIGLTITKSLIESMDGRIGFDSKAGQGSVFWIELPEASTQPSLMQPQPEAEKAEIEDIDQLDIKVLYIEDNVFNQDLMAQLMKQFTAVELLVESDAELGLITAQSERPDIILMDINLPGMSGIEALAEIRKTEELAHIPVIAVSADSMNREVEQGKRAGFNAYLTKPFKLQDIIKLITQTLNIKLTQSK